jgi:hypothetical protein
MFSSSATSQLFDEMKVIKSRRTPENNDKTDLELVFLTWQSYNQTKVDGINSIARVPDQTTDFFAHISKKFKKELKASTNNIIQFGISLGRFFEKSKLLSRNIIGYDYSPIAINHITSKKIQGRLVNLNEIDNQTNELACHKLLTTDLATAAEILIIRTLECLTPEAVVLLIQTILDLAKVGSTIYIETWQGEKETITGRSIPERYIASFFAPRTDIDFKLWEFLLDDDPDAKPMESINRLIVRKR